jgi:pimeloyl-ACP methyl ester carboxylesterase
MTTITTDDGVRLAVNDWGGDGPALVFVHAWGLTSAQWDYQIPALSAAGYRCITFDKRGHGRSDQTAHGYDHDRLADDLAVVIDQLGLASVVLVGHSFGGGTIARYLTRHGDERVRGTVLIAPSTPCLLRRDDNPTGLDPQLVESNLSLLAADVPQWCALNAPGYFGPSSSASPGLVEWTVGEIVNTRLPVLLATARANFWADLRDDLRAVRVPTLVLHGDADMSAPLELTGRPTAALVPGARLEVYEGIGHGLYAGEHGRVNGDLLSFLADHVRQPA